MSKYFFLGLLVLLGVKRCPAALIVDDFTSGLFVVQAQEDTIERIDVSQELSDVFASSRSVDVDGLQIAPGAVGATSISVEGDGLFRCRTDFHMELLSVRWTGFSFDATGPDTNVLVLDFTDFNTTDDNLDGFFSLSLRNGPLSLHRVGVISFGELLGGASVAIALDDVPPDDTFDWTQVDGIRLGTTHAFLGTSFQLKSVALVPEPSGMTFFLLGTLCLCRRSQWRA